MIDNLFAVDQSFLRVGRPLAIALAVSALGVPFAGAQSEDDDEIFELSPFTVDASSDVGYRSTNSTSGTSLNTPIKDIPMSINVINQELLKDRGANTFADALEYESGVFTEEFSASDGVGQDGVNAPGANAQDSADRSPSSRGGLGGRFDNVVIIRGFNVPFQNRDGFRYGGLIAHTGTVLGGVLDASNIDRMEVVRGPNSLLYGVGVLSGIVNVIPKKPLSAQSGSFDIAVGSEGYLRSTLDITGPLVKNFLGGQLNYRLAATHEEADHWTDHRSSELDYYVGQLQYQSEKLTVFLEGQYAEQQYNGIGSQFVYDNLNAALDRNFRNDYGEQYNWTQDFDTDGNYIGGLDAVPSAYLDILYDENGDYTGNRDQLPELGFQNAFDDEGNYVGGEPTISDSYRITGPDTYDRREEENVMLNVDYTPIEGLTISAGAFITKAEEELFNVNISTLTNEERGFDLGTILGRATDSNYLFSDELAQFREDYVTVSDSGVDVGGEFTDSNDYRLARYWWVKEPEITTTEQYRLRLAYNFETEDFLGDGKATHTFLVGRHDIKDEADIIDGTENIDYQYDSPTSGRFANIINPLGEIAGDSILQFRNIFETEEIRFDAENDKLATPGDDYRNIEIWFSGHYALYQGRFMNDKLGMILGARHDRYHSRERYYDRFDDEAVYNSEEIIGDYDPEVDGNEIAPPSTPEWENGDNETFGFSTAVDEDRYLPSVDGAETEVTTTIALNYKITDGLTIYGVRAEGLTPNTGALDGAYNGVESETSTSSEIGLKFELWDGKFSGSIAYYKIERENALWEYSFAPAPSKWPIAAVDENGELVLDETGGVVVLAPINDTSSNSEGTSFAPWLVSGQNVADAYGRSNQSYTISYGVDRYYFEEENILKISSFTNEDGESGLPAGYLGNQLGGGTSNPRNIFYLDYADLDSPVITVVGAGRTVTAHERVVGGYVVDEVDGVEYLFDPVFDDNENIVDLNAFLDGDGAMVAAPDERLTWRYFIEQAFADVSRTSSEFNGTNGPEDFDPIDYDRDRNTPNGINSALGNVTSANVVYADESTGIDFNFIYSVNDNWQVLFSYAHTEREATSPFTLVPVDWVDPDSGQTFSFGTEYDAWVRTFGREAYGLLEYDDNDDGVVDRITDAEGNPLSVGDVSPTSLVGGLQGTSLYSGAEDSASIWTKYNFTEGRFKRLGVGIGAVYTGSSATSIPIGGQDFATNQYGTPPTEERIKVDATVDYKWTWNDIDWALRFNVYNLTDDTSGIAVIDYVDMLTGEEFRRRTEVLYTPRTYRLSLSVNF